MSEKDILDAIRSIERAIGDNSWAQQLEDKLHKDFIGYLAAGHFGDISEKVQIVLRAEKLDFNRWYS